MHIDTKLYTTGDSEYNLLAMFRTTLQKAFAKHYATKKTGGVARLAHAMGISEKQVYNMLDMFDLRPLLTQTKPSNENRKMKVNGVRR